MMNFFAVDHT